MGSSLGVLFPVAGIISRSLLEELAVYLGAFGGIGAAAGWVGGLVVRGIGKNKPTVADAVGWSTGAGAFFGVMLVFFNQTWS